MIEEATAPRSDVQVLTIIDSLDPGGAEQSLVDLLPHLQARGVMIDMAVLNDRVGERQLAPIEGTTVISLADGGRLGWVRRARRLIRERRPDLVHTTLFEADVAGRIAGAATRTPVVSSLVNVAYGPEQLATPGLSARKVRAARAADAATARFVRRFHANSNYVARVMGARLRIPSDRIDVVYRGRDPAKLGLRTEARGVAARRSLDIGATTPLLVAIARHEYQKGLDVLLEAMPAVVSRVRDARLLIVGRPGLTTAALDATVARLHLQDAVRLLGTRDDVGDVLSAADAFVLPSRWEGFPGAVLEAMALEAPVVATRIPPVEELLGPEPAAMLVHPEDPEGLARAVVGTLDDPAGAAARAAAGRARFLAEFTIEVVAERMRACYERALSGT